MSKDKKKKKKSTSNNNNNMRNTLVPKKKDNSAVVLIGMAFLITSLLAFHVTNLMYPPKGTVETNHTIGIGSNEPQGMELGNALFAGFSSFSDSPLGIFPTTAMIIPVLLGNALFFAIAYVTLCAYKETKKSDLPNGADGSAEWNEDYKGYNEKYTHPHTKEMKQAGVADPNVLLSKNVKLGMNNRQTQRNLNAIVFGGSGTGKSFGVIKPNIMQLNCSTITTDPSGELLQCTGEALMQNGITVKVFSTSDMVHSNCYNPFDYVYDEKGKIDETKVSTLIFLFLKNANGAKEKSGDPFWEKSAKALLSALAYYLLEGAEYGMLKRSEINFTKILDLVQAGKVNEDSSSSESPLDKLINERNEYCRTKGLRSRANENYATFKLATGKTANSILITCAVDLQLFSTTEVKNLTRTNFDDDSNNLHLEKVGDEQTALFINIPQANATYNFLVSMMYSQLFDTLYNRAEKICPTKWLIKDEYDRPIISMIDSEKQANQILEDLQSSDIRVQESRNFKGLPTYRVVYGKQVLCEKSSEIAANKVIELAKKAHVEKGKLRLPWHVRCLMDEFANIGEIPEFKEMLATMRKYEISCVIVLQSLAQLKVKYDKAFEGIIGNCDSMIFLGSTESETCEYISKMLGKATITSKNTSRSYGGKGGYSQSFQSKARSLLEINEVSLVDNKFCIIRVRGEKPFFDEKYSFLEHPNFQQTGDYDEANGLTTEKMDIAFNTTPKNELAKRNEEEARRARKLSKAKASIITMSTSTYSSPQTKAEIAAMFDKKSLEEVAQSISSVSSDNMVKRGVKRQPVGIKEAGATAYRASAYEAKDGSFKIPNA